MRGAETPLKKLPQAPRLSQICHTPMFSKVKVRIQNLMQAPHNSPVFGAFLTILFAICLLTSRAF